jgi:hypothetical protein
VKLAGRILLAVVALLARLTGLDELLDAITLPLLFLEEWRRSVVRKPILRSSDSATSVLEQ